MKMQPPQSGGQSSLVLSEPLHLFYIGADTLADDFKGLCLRLRRDLGKLAHMSQRFFKPFLGNLRALSRAVLFARIGDSILHSLPKDLRLPTHQSLPTFKRDLVGFCKRLDIFLFAIHERRDINARYLVTLQQLGEVWEWHFPWLLFIRLRLGFVSHIGFPFIHRDQGQLPHLCRL